MQQQVIQLRKKVKMLEYDLCQRTRNYMHHFKKTPPKVQPLTIQQQTQTDHVLVTYVQQEINTDKQEPNQFANITLEVIQAKRSINPQTVKEPLTLDIYELQAQSSKAIQSQTHSHRQQIDEIASEIRVMKEQLQATRTPKNKSELKFQFVGLGEKLNPRENDTSLLGENSMKDLSKVTGSGIKMSENGMGSEIKTPQAITSTNQFSKKPQPPQFQTISQQSQHKRKGSFESHLTTKTKQQIQHETLNKQLKIMKKQIKKLKHRLEEELKISSQTKEALLISEEENYNFRLKIQKLNKEILILTGGEAEGIGRELNFGEEDEAGNQADPLVLKEVESNQSESTKDEVEKWKGQLEKYEEHIFMLEGVKRDYLKKCIQAKEDICKLKGQNQQLVKQINELRRELSQINHTKANIQHTKLQTPPSYSSQAGELSTPCYSSSPLLPSQLHSPTFHQHLKQKIHQISNCLPVTQTHEDSCLFRPETVEDIIKMLERILEFCKNIEAWERDKIAAIQKERANLLQVLSGVIMKYPQARHQIAELISQIDQLKYLVNFLNRDQKRSISTVRDNMSPERDNMPVMSPQRDNLMDISPQRPCSGSIQISITPASQVPIQQLN